ncbi:carbamoyltransferase C-terminal domain-containing protein [Undibacterium sp. TS12]|uniref:carbamoyltransferase family protein n=1 Tax=Undibacterium sp. TS12 TaxID=2908202 RepID=UPI001F4CDA07|nr:carbamoyltransferase C-terminal domain-containing protein [Undibacterium sp. TS12]MCH8623088.1 nodulation protein [Undibacterium sp. TS12]
MLVLGWHGGWNTPDFGHNAGWRSRPGVIGHDAAAAIMSDGKVIAAIEEERLNRMKHCNFFPEEAIRFCLNSVGATLTDLDAIAVDTSEEFLDLWILQERFALTGPVAGSGRRAIASLFERAFGVDIARRIVFCRHHMAHLYAAWYTSGFDHGLNLCLDAAGDGPSGLIAQCNADHTQILRQISIDRSLGYFYVKLIGLLGYRLFDEYKVMGLAPYGNAKVYSSVLKRLYRLEPNGQYSLMPMDQRNALLAETGLVSNPRRKGEPFTQVHKDFAAALQEALQDIVMHVLRHFQAMTGEKKLCLSGGVAQNCSMNGVILRSGLFDQVHVPPVSHDAGNALGAAIHACRELGQTISPTVMPHPYLGSDIGSDETIGAMLADWQPLIESRKVQDAPAVAAELIVNGHVIAWVQGRSEYGPRALGNRSILADPRKGENKQIINAMVKMREGYRPFAPSVIEEQAKDYFEFPALVSVAPYMTIIVPVHPHEHAHLGAITHVDGTARVQTVSKVSNPLYHQLIEHVGKLSGVPMVLNTSFNNHAEPIVDSVDDAVTCFLTTGIERLVVGNWIVEKTKAAEKNDVLFGLIPSVPSHRKLVRKSLGSSTSFTLDSLAHDAFAEPSISVSNLLFQLLLDADDDAISARISRIPDLTDADLDNLHKELFDVWQRRGIALMPDRRKRTPEKNRK